MLPQLPQAILTAHELRDEAKRLMLLADELEASARVAPVVSDGVFMFGKEGKVRRTRK